VSPNREHEESFRCAPCYAALNLSNLSARNSLLGLCPSLPGTQGFPPVHLLQLPLEHRPIMLAQHVRPNVHAVVRADAQDVHVVRRVVDLAEGEAVGDLGESRAFVAAVQGCARRRGDSSCRNRCWWSRRLAVTVAYSRAGARPTTSACVGSKTHDSASASMRKVSASGESAVTYTGWTTW
jgi:hypothetical protein